MTPNPKKKEKKNQQLKRLWAQNGTSAILSSLWKQGELVEGEGTTSELASGSSLLPCALVPNACKGDALELRLWHRRRERDQPRPGRRRLPGGLGLLLEGRSAGTALGGPGVPGDYFTSMDCEASVGTSH